MPYSNSEPKWTTHCESVEMAADCGCFSAVVINVSSKFLIGRTVLMMGEGSKGTREVVLIA